MKRVLVLLVLALSASLAGAAIDPANPDWVIYRDTYSADESTAGYYDYYQEVAQGETFTLHVVVNFNPPAGTGYQVRAYASAFWFDAAVIAGIGYGDGTVHPLPNYTWSWLGSMYDPPEANYEVWNYVQLINDSWTVRSLWEEPAEAPYVVVSWDIPIRPDAPLGETTIPMRFGTYDINGTNMEANSVETDPAFTINVIAGGFDLGDFDQDGDVDTDDIDILCDNMGDAAYDVDGDGDADEDDLDFLIEELVELTDGSGRTGTQRGDFNLDGLINATDLATMNANFGSSDGKKYGEGNANCDELINATDLAILAGNFGYIAPAGAVPEPVTMSLLAIGGVALLRRRTS